MARHIFSGPHVLLKTAIDHGLASLARAVACPLAADDDRNAVVSTRISLGCHQIVLVANASARQRARPIRPGDRTMAFLLRRVDLTGETSAPLVEATLPNAIVRLADMVGRPMEIPAVDGPSPAASRRPRFSPPLVAARPPQVAAYGIVVSPASALPLVPLFSAAVADISLSRQLTASLGPDPPFETGLPHAVTAPLPARPSASRADA